MSSFRYITDAIHLMLWIYVLVTFLVLWSMKNECQLQHNVYECSGSVSYQPVDPFHPEEPK